MNFSYIITHRENTATRQNNLNFILSWISLIELDIEIILVEQDITQKIIENTLPANCKYIFAYNKGLFNRAWGLNVGFQHSLGKSIVFADNDVIVDKDILKECLELCCNEDYDAIKPFNTLIDLSECQSQKVFKTMQLPDSSKFSKEDIRLGISFCSALMVFKRSAYEKLGGFDERFIGWGGEDDAMSTYKIPLLNNAYVNEDSAYHLWHERSGNDSRLQPNYNNNLKLLKEYYNYSKKDILQLCESAKTSFGKLKSKSNNKM